MKQICKFNIKPATINNGGYKKGRWVVWINLSVSEIKTSEDGQDERFQSITDRLVMNGNSIEDFFEVIDPLHLALATVNELEAILCYFQCENDIEAWKTIRKIQIRGYDSSENVNRFYLGDIALWLDKATRVGLVNSITIEKKAKRNTTCLWYENNHINMSVDTTLDLLYQLELYALSCYNVTAQHLVYIDQCEEIAELRSFDVCSDYPDILQFKNE